MQWHRHATFNRRSHLGGAHLVHYSHTKGLSVIDPKFIGSGKLNFRERQDTRVPVSYWYVKGTEPERLILSATIAKYETTLPADAKILDLANPPEAVVDGYKNDGRGGMYKAIQSLGFSGFMNSQSDLPNALCLFDPLPVREVEKE